MSMRRKCIIKFLVGMDWKPWIFVRVCLGTGLALLVLSREAMEMVIVAMNLVVMKEDREIHGTELQIVFSEAQIRMEK